MFRANVAYFWGSSLLRTLFHALCKTIPSPVWTPEIVLFTPFSWFFLSFGSSLTYVCRLLLSQWLEWMPLHRYLELSLQFAPPQCCVPQNLAVLTSPNYELSPQLIETTRTVPLPCPEAWNLSRQWAKVFIGLISFVSFSQESLLCCLLSSVWKLTFHIFFFWFSS